jgi:uncharacterized protein YkwD
MNFRHFLVPPVKTKMIAIAILSTATLAGCTATQATSLPSPASSAIAVSPTPVAPVSSTPVPVPSPSPSPAPSPSPTPKPSPSPSSSPSPSPTPAPASSPAAIFTPTATPLKPTADQLDMMTYVLGLVNKDRQANGLTAVVLNFDAAAQQHAQDMLDNQYVAHWGTDGQKPYMRYTVAGGLNKEGENSAYYSTSAPKIDVKAQLQALETGMLAETPPNDGHRQNILNKWHKKVNIGVANNNNSVALVQQFEGDYIEYYQPPTITGNLFSLNGRFTQPGIVLNNIAVTFDDLPQKLTGQQLMNGPYHSYGLGKVLGQVFPPAPAGSAYAGLPANSVIGATGTFDKSGQFSIQADISSLLAAGKGVYTIVLVAQAGTEVVPFSNYSIFIK